MTEQRINCEKKGNIFYLTLNRPQKRNAISLEMLEEFCDTINPLAKDPEIRVIIVKGEGSVFSAGIDFNALGEMAGTYLSDEAGGGGLIRADIHQGQQWLNRLEAIEIPIICAMHGGVYGLGVEVALACDIRLMSEDCTWGLPEAQFGLIADLGGTARLAKLLGPSRAMEILMTTNRYPAQRALEWGLINYLYPTKEALYAGAEKLAADIIKSAPLPVGAFKKIINRGQGVDLMTHLDMEASMQSIMLRSEDFKEGVTALMEKREPSWKRK
ncbi:MAG: enoyl-CoA hydratase/isomerase family protein [Deltaproteobacteria bacterium]|nr:enoyl-CoA hydratase/isomerase family protein [Deltaproteobacteria bacterium]